MAATLEIWIAVVRALHFAAVIVLFGQFVFLFAIAPAPPRRLAHTAGWSLAVALATALGWLALEAMSMSGQPLRLALGRDTLVAVLGETLFGRVWLVRLLMAAGLCLAVAASRSSEHRVRRAAQTVGALLAALLLATLAAMGHAAGERGVDRTAHLSADALHLLAAGAWLGALVPLVGILKQGSGPTYEIAVQATRRFSTLGVAAMSALLLSGVINAAYTVGTLAALYESQYGRLLLVKLALYVLIVALAAANRLVWTPRLAAASAAAVERARAFHKLRRNSITEAALGFAIIALVGKLGTTMPGMHMQ
jgi:copper resistance protein D